MLYVIYSKLDKSTIGITEYKTRMLLFINQHGMSSDDIGYIEISNPNIINGYLSKYDNLILDDYCYMILPTEDMKIFSNIIDEEKDRIKNILQDMEHILKNYSLNSTESKTIKNCFDVLLGFRKKTRLVARLNIKEIFLKKFTPNRYRKIDDYVNNIKELMQIYNSKK